jgi:preprotein translocase subunit YajC
MKNNAWAIALIIIIAIWIIMTIFISIADDSLQNKRDYRLDELEKGYEKLTKERGMSWTQVNGVPDSIYFVSFKGDTTWYIKIKKQGEW